MWPYGVAVLDFIERYRDAIASLVSLLGVVGGMAGLYLLWKRTSASTSQADAAIETAKVAVRQAEIATKRHEGQTAADRERRITDSFHLGRNHEMCSPFHV